MKYIALSLALTAVAATAHADTPVPSTSVYSFSGINLEIPDAPNVGNPVTVSDTHTVLTPFDTLFDITVTLDIVGSDGAGGPGAMWNGDLYVTLAHENGAFAVLLNRIGKDLDNALGSSGSGIAVTLDSSALIDVHTLSSGPASGTYQSDGRSTDPTVVTTTSLRPAQLSDMATSLRNTPNGQWTLSVTDLEGGSLARLRGWTLNLTGVPEPGTYAVVTGLALAALGWARAGSRRFR